MGTLVRIWICIFAFGLLLYTTVDRQNELKKRQRDIPHLRRQVKAIEEDNTHLRFEVDCFESPQNLMELLRRPEYGHLHYPNSDEIITVEQSLDH